MDATNADGDGAGGFDAGMFAKTLPDDCVQYTILVLDDKLKSEFELRERLKAVQAAAVETNKTLLEDYIWQRDGFDLALKRTASRGPADPLSLSWMLKGSTNFGDSIADEWLVVHLLLRLTNDFPDIWVRVVDTDGEFLLIEAANALPKWLNPEIADNRVWLQGGKLRIIPLADGKEQVQSSNLTLERAVRLISADSRALLHDQSIQDEAFFRLRDYPAAIQSVLHRSVVSIPRRLAHVLHRNARYVSPAVEAFYLRDAISLKPLGTKDTGTLHFPPEDFVKVGVKCTKVGFAQLKSQTFAPPPSWTAVTPHIKDGQVSEGMKLTCGFEMLLQDKHNQDKRAVREMKILLEDVDAGDETLPTDHEIAGWPRVQDDEKWLDIDFEDFERELDGKSGRKGAGQNGQGAGDFGDKAAQDNLKKIVSRFESFLADDKAGLDGADADDMDDDDDDDDDDGSEVDSQGEDKDGSFDDEEFERAMREMMGMPADEVEKSGLLDEARRLALDMEDESEGERDEEEETRKVMELMAGMEKELRGHGALDMKEVQKRAESAGQKGFLAKDKGAQRIEDEEELSSDEDLLEENEVDMTLLRNVLESFKGQGGMAGPAGNMLAAMGMQLPRDEGEVKHEGGAGSSGSGKSSKSSKSKK